MVKKNYVIWIVHIITDDINKSSGEEVESRSDTFNYQLETPLLKEKKKKKAIGLMKDELDRKIMVTFFGLKAKSYLLDDGSEGQKVKDRKKT